MNEKELRVNLGDNSYPIFIGANILKETGKKMRAIGFGKKCAVITNPEIGRLYTGAVAESLKKEGFEVKVLKIPEGEIYKSLEIANELYGRLLSSGFDRKSCIIALGGGVIGDLAGFVASTYMRGVPFVQIPTTLLAQVDSSIGGKVAVNHTKCKNLIGSFYQPKLVLADVKTLKTLPEREMRSGLAEVIKYGIIQDGGFFEYLEKNIQKIMRQDEDTLALIIKKSCSIKAGIVEKDEKESGLRSILNYGHTFGHALECTTNFKKYRHGEAVAIGMAFAARLSNSMGILEKPDMDRQISLLRAAGLETEFKCGKDSKRMQNFIELMRSDKKSLDGKIRFVISEGIGKVKMAETVPEDLVKSALEAMIR